MSILTKGLFILIASAFEGLGVLALGALGILYGAFVFHYVNVYNVLGNGDVEWYWKVILGLVLCFIFYLVAFK